MDSALIIVSGLPRSGTSLMMQILERGGVEVVTDNVRAADEDNPRGYYECEKAKRLKADASWLPEVRGKALKVVSQLLYELPPTERYRVILMERELDELLVSQEKMLERLGRNAVPRDAMKRSYTLHLARLHQWLSQQPYMEVLRISYNDLLKQTQREVKRVSDFLGGRMDVEQMARAVDPSLHRNR